MNQPDEMPSARIVIRASSPVPGEAIAEALAAAHLSATALPDATLEVSAPIDVVALCRLVTQALDAVASMQPRSLVPERLSLTEFALRPAAG